MSKKPNLRLVKKPEESGYPFDGVSSAADLLNSLDINTRQRLLNNLQARDPKMTEAIQKKMVRFEDLEKLPSKNLQLLLKEIPEQTLALALRTATTELKSQIFKNLTKTASQSLKDALASQSPQKQSLVNRAQHEILVIAKRFLPE